MSKAQTVHVFGRHYFGPSERDDLQRQLVNTIHNLELKEAEKKAATKDFGADIAQLQKNMHGLSRKIRDGYEEREIACTVERDYILKERRYISIMDGSVVKADPFCEADYQMRIQDAEVMSRKDEPDMPPPAPPEESEGTEAAEAAEATATTEADLNQNPCEACEKESCDGCQEPGQGEDDEPKCRVCGCTNEHACEGGCYWVEEDLCSQCVDVCTVCKAAHRGCPLCCRDECKEPCNGRQECAFGSEMVTDTGQLFKCNLCQRPREECGYATEEGCPNLPEKQVKSESGVYIWCPDRSYRVAVELCESGKCEYQETCTSLKGHRRKQEAPAPAEEKPKKGRKARAA